MRRRRALLVRVILGVVGDVRSYRLRTAGWKTSWRACATLKNPRATRRSAGGEAEGSPNSGGFLLLTVRAIVP